MPSAALWARLWACTALCSLSAGIVPGQTLFVEFFANAGVFQSFCHDEEFPCDQQYLQMARWLNLASVFLLGAGLFFGSAFDRWGGQVCGTVGSVIVATSFAALACLLWLIPICSGYNLGLSYGVVFGIILADCGCTLNSYAMLGMIWHFPQHQALVLCLLNCTYQVGAFFAMIVERVIDDFHVSVAVPLMAWCILQFLSTFFLWWVVPTQEDYLTEARKVLGIPLPPPAKDIAKQIRCAWRILQMDAWDHSVLGVTLMTSTTYVSLYFAMAVPLGNELFGSKDGGRWLGNLCAFATGTIGLVTSPSLGSVVDRYGFGVIVWSQILFFLIFSLTFWVRSEAASVLAAIASVVFQGDVWMQYTRWFVPFCVPHRLGMVSGLFTFIVSIGTMVVTIVLTTWSGLLPHGLERFALPLGACGALTMVCLAYFSHGYWLKPPFPEVPRLIVEDEEELARPWGCKYLAEVGELLDIRDRVDVIRHVLSHVHDAAESEEKAIELQELSSHAGTDESTSKSAVACTKDLPAEPGAMTMAPGGGGVDRGGSRSLRRLRASLESVRSTLRELGLCFRELQEGLLVVSRAT